MKSILLFNLLCLNFGISAQYQMIGDTETEISDFAKSTSTKIEKLYDADNNAYLLVTKKSHSASYYFNGKECVMVAIFPASDDDLMFYIYNFNHSDKFKKVSDDVWTCLVGTKIIAIQYVVSGDLKYFICKEI